MKKTTCFKLLLFALILSGNALQAQQARFKAGVVAGLNFSELTGKNSTDYYGLNVGILGTARLSKHTQAGIEFLFSQNGEYILPEFYPELEYGTIWLNHIEIPFHLDWLIGVFQKDQFYDWNLNLGVAYTKLVGYRVEDLNKVDVTDQIVYGNKEAFLLQAGTTYHFTKNIGLNLKASLPIRIDGLNWTLAGRLVYLLD
ncbi:MAG: outer membrane beta-barrel protein [Saprospiraceae bacterium]